MTQDIALLLARSLIAVLFIQSAFPKIGRSREEIAASTAHHIPAAGVLVPLAGLCELAGAIMLVAGIGARIAALLLALFMAGVTALFLRFWSAPAEQRHEQSRAFFSNLTTIGGLLAIAAMGPGAFAFYPGS